MRNLLDTFFKHERTFKLILLFCVISAVIGNFLVAPIYESDAKVFIGIGREMTMPTTVMTQPLNVILDRNQGLNTEIAKLTSRDVVRKTLAVLGAKKKEEEQDNSFVGRAARAGGKFFRKALFFVWKDKEGSTEEAAITDAIKHLKATHGETSQVVDISYRDSDPQYAHDFLTALINVFDQSSPAGLDSAKALKFFTVQEVGLVKKLNTAREELSSFRRQWNISDLGAQKQNLVEAMMRISNDLLQLQIQIDTVTGQIDAVKKAPLEGVDAYMSEDLRQDQALLEVSRNITNIRTRYSKLAPLFGTAHPDVVNLVSQLHNMETDMRKSVLAILSRKLDTLRIKEKSLVEKQEDLRQQSQQLDDKGLEMQMLEREVKALESKFYALSDKKETSRVNAELDIAKINSIGLIESPSVPTVPVFPKKILNIVLSVFLGFILGGCYVFIYEKITGRVNFVEELQSMLDCRACISIPDLSAIGKEVDDFFKD